MYMRIATILGRAFRASLLRTTENRLFSIESVGGVGASLAGVRVEVFR
jgi:hypothetical protein